MSMTVISERERTAFLKPQRNEQFNAVEILNATDFLKSQRKQNLRPVHYAKLRQKEDPGIDKFLEFTNYFEPTTQDQKGEYADFD
jgi:hypothetical protein